MFKWLFYVLIFATTSGKYQNKEKPLIRQRKLGLPSGLIEQTSIADEMPHYAAFYMCLHSTHLKSESKSLPVVLDFCYNCCNNKNPTHLKSVFVAISIRDI